MSAAKFSLDPVQVSFETAHPVTAARPVMFGDELQAEPLPGIPGLEVIVYYSSDDALVVQIDTKEIDMISRRGRLRVNLNDDTIYDGDPDTDTWPDFDRHIKIACDDLYDEPDSLEARATLLALLTRSCAGTARTTERDYARRIKIACQDLYDDPRDRAAQHVMLALLQHPQSMSF